MDVRPSEEQALLRDMMRRFLADRVSAAEIGRAPMAQVEWQAMGELGVLAITLPETAGGMGAAPQDAAIIAEELGRAIAITPFAEAMLGAADLIARHGTGAQIAEWVNAAASGARIVALAEGEVTLDDGMLHGRCDLVRWGGAADAFLILSNGSVFLLPGDAQGLTRSSVRLADGSIAAALTLERCDADRMVLTHAEVTAALAMAQLGYVAELVGIMALLHEQTTDYARQRQQFGAPIASFQAVQHKLARMFVRLEQSRSMLMRASLLRRDAPEFATRVLAAKAYVADSAQLLAEDAVQLHGGMGVTDELAVGRALRRVMVLGRLFGRADQARQMLAA